MKLKKHGALLVNFVIDFANGDMSRRICAYRSSMVYALWPPICRLRSIAVAPS